MFCGDMNAELLHMLGDRRRGAGAVATPADRLLSGLWETLPIQWLGRQEATYSCEVRGSEPDVVESLGTAGGQGGSR